jgi:nicotinamidase-related amidase
MVPELHAQWHGLDFADLLGAGTAFVNMDCQNSILASDGVLSHEAIWQGARKPGGSLFNILRLAAATRALDLPCLWLRYDRFVGEREPKTPLDIVQYRHWNENYRGDAARKVWEAELVDEVKAILRPGDLTMVYPAWSIFSATPVERWLLQAGARTLILSGYHTDWCVEMAARSARDLGFMPIVVGDACGSTHPWHEQSLAQINDCYAPVVSTESMIAAIEQARMRNERAA